VPAVLARGNDCNHASTAAPRLLHSRTSRRQRAAAGQSGRRARKQPARGRRAAPFRFAPPAPPRTAIAARASLGATVSLAPLLRAPQISCAVRAPKPWRPRPPRSRRPLPTGAPCPSPTATTTRRRSTWCRSRPTSTPPSCRSCSPRCAGPAPAPLRRPDRDGGASGDRRAPGSRRRAAAGRRRGRRRAAAGARLRAQRRRRAPRRARSPRRCRRHAPGHHPAAASPPGGGARPCPLPQVRARRRAAPRRGGATAAGACPQPPPLRAEPTPALPAPPRSLAPCPTCACCRRRTRVGGPQRPAWPVPHRHARVRGRHARAAAIRAPPHPAVPPPCAPASPIPRLPAPSASAPQRLLASLTRTPRRWPRKPWTAL
jgi:hypothetical protein